MHIFNICKSTSYFCNRTAKIIFGQKTICWHFPVKSSTLQLPAKHCLPHPKKFWCCWLPNILVVLHTKVLYHCMHQFSLNFHKCRLIFFLIVSMQWRTQADKPSYVVFSYFLWSNIVTEIKICHIFLASVTVFMVFWYPVKQKNLIKNCFLLCSWLSPYETWFLVEILIFSFILKRSQ